MTAAADKPASKLRWGELDDEDEAEDLAYLLPPRQVLGPDENGIKKVIEYKFNEEGKKVKITTTTRVRKLAEARLTKQAMERREWGKFGDVVDDDVRANLTMVSTEEIFLERPRPFGTKQDEPKAPNVATSIMLCRYCGRKGEHWSARCPFKDLNSQIVDVINPPNSERPPPTKSVYVPPNIRSGEERRPLGSEMRRRNEENSVRVTNLSEDTREPDLLELFRTFGQVSRVYVAMDQKTGMSRGFGFVNFVNKQDAEGAIAKLNGYGYDNLILRVEWATPRTN